ncbi:hypothetical protein E5676_scaffold1251G00680 [Cucumis melo var. makuwa]|uniref:Uncharacterized protein n=1 Tax=Cucumis melo var. makuwa TaxID=1194695 RepID=A0A5A7TSD5_CUCMM|nr:hypothetical protein E6C27_scaffold543G00250 [Cucumis melo var. makuwa]TYJ97760.1 hypothetical protein E5676_scaffold1251G00680 [Cucumis melo var. makuwa]
MGLLKKKPANNKSQLLYSLYEFTLPFSCMPGPMRQCCPLVGGLPIGSYHLRYHTSCDGVSHTHLVEDQVGRGYVDTEMAVSKSVVRDALSKALPTCKRDDIGTWAECVKKGVEHYYELRRRKYEVASNRNDPCSSVSKKLIGKGGANDKIENQMGNFLWLICLVLNLVVFYFSLSNQFSNPLE